MVRCFVGIMVPEGVRASVAALQARLASSIKCKLVEQENMHLCLSFLGEVEEGRIEGIEANLDAVAASYKKFPVEIGKIKFVPSESYIRVVVLEASDESGMLEKIRKDVVKAVGGDSKPPHLTLCRVKLVEDKKRFVDDFGNAVCGEKFSVDGLHLIKSELGRGGPVYTIMHSSSLS